MSHHKVVFKSEQAELMLKMNAKINVFYAVNDDVYKLCTSHL